VDRQPPGASPRSWSYWTDQPTLFDPVVCHRWTQLQVASPRATRQLPLPGYRYEMVRGADLERFAHETLAAQPGVTFQIGAVEQILDGARAARVMIAGQPVDADWVFDSTQRPSRRPGRAQPYRLAMHFRGWTIDTPADTFDPGTATFLDFRTVQASGARFFYVLPFTPRQALVQLVLLAPDAPGPAAARAALDKYLRRAWDLGDYTVGAEEAGSLAITPAHRPRRLGPHVMAVGLKAGLVKPSTGFGFWRIQQDSAAIARSLTQTAAPWAVPPVSERHRWYDALLLDVLARHGGDIEAIFEELFARNPLERVLRFLDETTTPAEDVALAATLPSGPFIEAAARRLIPGLSPF
jgi:lycopene beta-cyclase